MDSLSQAVLGASVVAAVLPVEQRRRGLVVGAILGTVPDLDTFIVPLFTQAPVALFTWHRGPSHALWILLLLAFFMWLVAKRYSVNVKTAPWRWLIGIALALITHPLLDAFTVYGTQLWWPSANNPIMWSSLFIIDPLYTVPLIIGVVCTMIGGPKRWAGIVLLTGLLLSTAYIGWSLLSRHISERAVALQLQAQGLGQAPRLLVNTPFNTLLWRVIVLEPNSYAIGYHHVGRNNSPLQLHHYPSETSLLATLAPQSADVRRLLWFTSGFVATEIVGNELILHDLRMGTEGAYAFSFRIAEQIFPQSTDDMPNWRALPMALPAPNDGSIRERMREEGRQTWQRLWQ